MALGSIDYVVCQTAVFRIVFCQALGIQAKFTQYTMSDWARFLIMNAFPCHLTKGEAAKQAW